MVYHAWLRLDGGTSKDLARLRRTIFHVEGPGHRRGDRPRHRLHAVGGHAVIVLDLRLEIVKPMTRWFQEVQKRGHFMMRKLGSRVLCHSRAQLDDWARNEMSHSRQRLGH
jgi:hypothetical protein